MPYNLLPAGFKDVQGKTSKKPADPFGNIPGAASVYAPINLAAGTGATAHTTPQTNSGGPLNRIAGIFGAYGGQTAAAANAVPAGNPLLSPGGYGSMVSPGAYGSSSNISHSGSNTVDPHIQRYFSNAADAVNQPIKASSVGTTPAIGVPSAPVLSGGHEMIGNNAGIASRSNGQLMMNPDGSLVDNPDTQFGVSKKVTDEESTSGIDRVRAMVGLGPPPSREQAYRDSPERAQRDAAQQEVNKRKAELNMIVAKSNAAQLATIGQGRGIPEVIIGGQQAQIAREAAIQALPVQALLANAQGNLELAEQQLDQMMKFKIEDARSQYEYKNKIIDSFYDAADKNDQRKLDAIKDQNDKAFQRETENNRQINEWSKMAVSSGQSNLVTQLTSLDPKSPTFKQEFGKIQGKIIDPTVGLDIQYKRAQIEALLQKSKEDKAGGKLTQAQTTALGYAQRVAESNEIITDLGSKFTGLTSYIPQAGIFGISLYPNIFKSPERQQYEQAQRNFVNSVLRRESGAAISPSEFENAGLQYFPQPGDSSAVVLQKTRNRNTTLNNLLREGGQEMPIANTATSVEIDYVNNLFK